MPDPVKRNLLPGEQDHFRRRPGGIVRHWFFDEHMPSRSARRGFGYVERVEVGGPMLRSSLAAAGFGMELKARTAVFAGDLCGGIGGGLGRVDDRRGRSRASSA